MSYKWALLAGASAMMIAAPAVAQESGSDPIALEEIVVTAQKREQNLQDIPLAVTALTGDTLASRNVATVSDLTRLAPSLTVTQGNVPTNNSINMRGIGTIAFSTGIEPSVAVIVDDVALLQQAQAFSGLSDIERIEVLRGPQGTLFGKNASAGAINIVTRAPTDTLSGSITGTATDDDEYRVDASVSGPIAEGVSFRLNGFYSDREGILDNLTTGEKLNGETSYGVRGRLKLNPTDRLSIDLIASHALSEGNGVARTVRTAPAGAAVFGTPIAPSLAGITPGRDNYSVRANAPFFNRSKVNTYTARASLDLGPVDLVSVTSYQTWRFRFAEDFDMTAQNVLGLPGGIVASSQYESNQVSQELRLVSTTDGPLSYVAGLFYADGETDRGFNRAPGAVSAAWVSNSGTRSYAAFAQATYDFTGSTHLDVGLRANHEKIDVRFQNLNPTASPPANNATCLQVCAGSAEDDAFTGKIALRQDLSDDVMVYGSFATGYKGQGFDISSGFTPTRAATPVKPETSKSYELGLKGRFWDRRLQLNTVLFTTDFEQFQAQSGVLLPDNTIQLTLNNVGAVRTRGVEIEMSAQLTEAFRLDAAFNYLDTEILSFKNAQCYGGQTAAQGCLDLDGAGPLTATGQDLAGKRLPNAPKYKFNVGGNYDVAFDDLPFDGFVTLDYSYQSQVSFDLLGNPVAVERGYGLLNGSVGVVQKGDTGYRVTLFASNILDERFASNVGIAAGGSIGLLMQTLPRNSQRYVGVKAAYRF